VATALCRSTGIHPSFLLHPLDFLGCDRVRNLSFFPGMNLSTAFKLELFDEFVQHIKRYFEPVAMETHAAAALRELNMATEDGHRVRRPAPAGRAGLGATERARRIG
jgi:hypothetical protein